MKIFMEKRNKIEKKNEEYEKGNKKLKIELKKYGEMIINEFVKNMNGLNRK
jgi:hypothetical protein